MSTTPPPGDYLPGGIFQSLTRKPDSSFIVGNVPAPTQAYVPPDGFFRVNIQSTFAGAQVIVTIRTMRSVDGVVTLSQDTLFPTASGAINTFFLPGVEGFILSATARTENLGLKRGQCFVSVQLCGGSQVDLHIQQILMQDYIEQAYAVAWPGGLIRQSTEGPGFIRQVAPGDPAAGNGLIFAVPNNRRWQLLSMWAQLTTAAPVANRAVFVAIDDGVGSDCYQAFQSGVLGASNQANYSLAAGLGVPSINNGLNLIPLPEHLILNAAMRIILTATGLQAGDTLANIRFLLEEWLEQ